MALQEMDSDVQTMVPIAKIAVALIILFPVVGRACVCNVLVSCRDEDVVSGHCAVPPCDLINSCTNRSHQLNCSIST